ncbi:MAG TPA: carboxypeptidase-like regulatory domain-containing protein [Nannocystaceae bacterium]|nr:carboxypeptidase-like regulatory domain-containing protein [Nannocystaceae bacterium]
MVGSALASCLLGARLLGPPAEAPPDRSPPSEVPVQRPSTPPVEPSEPLPSAPPPVDSPPVEPPPVEPPPVEPPPAGPPGEPLPQTPWAPPVEPPPPAPTPTPPPEQTRAPPPKPARARVRGRVLIHGERTPLPGARVIPKDGRPAVTADDQGAFVLELGPGRHEFIVRAAGYDDLSTSVVLSANQELEFEYRLQPSIEGHRYRTIVRQNAVVGLSSTTLRENELRDVPGTQGDPLRVINSLPGVSPLHGLLPYAVVRGAAPGNTGYYLDGTRVPALFHVALGPSVIHPFFIDAVDFYPSGPPARLGRYISGIIEARTKSARRDRVHGEVEARLTRAGMFLEIPVNRAWLPDCHEKRRLKCKRGPGKGALTLAGQYAYTAAILSLAQSQARIRFWDYQARFDHPVGDRTEATVFAFGSFDEVGEKPHRDAMGNRVVPDPFVRYTFHRIDTRLRQRLRNDGSAIYRVVFGLDQTGVTNIKTNEWRIAPRVDVRVPVNERIAIGFGLDQEFQFFRLDKQLDELEDVNVEDVALLFSERFVTATGGYLELVGQRGGFEARPGVRMDVYAQFGASPYVPNAKSSTYAIGVDPRLALREKIAPRWTLKQSIGLYHQPPSFPIPIPGIESFGFERGLQQNAQGSFGYELAAIPDRLQLSQEAYVGYLSNLQDYEIGQAAENEPVEELEDVITKVTGWAYGLETMLKLDPGMRMFGWIAYTLSRSTRDFRIGGHAPSNWDQRHILNVVLGYRISQKWNFGFRVHYHTGRPWTAPVGGESVLDALGRHRNNARLPAYFQLDFRVERNWRFPNWQLDVFLDVTNGTLSREVFQCTASDESLLGNGLRMALVAGVDPNRAMAKCTPQGFRYILPDLGIRARW